MMLAEVVSLSEYKNKLQEEELNRLTEQVDEIIKNLPDVDPTIGWYDNPNYVTWLSPSPNLEYIYEQSQSCPCCGKSYDEE